MILMIIPGWSGFRVIVSLLPVYSLSYYSRDTTTLQTQLISCHTLSHRILRENAGKALKQLIAVTPRFVEQLWVGLLYFELTDDIPGTVFLNLFYQMSE